MNGAQGQPAWVLHRRAFRESSTLVELFSQEYGRIGAVANGVRRRGWSGQLEPFIPLQVSWRGRGDLKTLTTVDQAGRGYALRGGALACGFYMAEVLLALTRREDPHPRTWERYAVAVDCLATDDAEPALRRFELALLEESGYGLELEQDVHGEPVVAQARYRYSPERGADRAGTGECGVEVSGATLLALAATEGQGLSEEPVRSEARRLMRAVIQQHLGGRRLRSREMFRSLRD
ncbi:DNA repair protein RecO [Halorhodospira halophila]|uniref:DNA repair protein RecO n=1 Tax=Halorhodospira halophila (strain DSM 244 / SL1) TaxID=349124 RepID=RECO_HALHL|nr:DNA repair protein RecO [Halorhodospira halophila]A1WT15.1 RecName: Full=DNA repair protein RecO; AltName: Full=Recombination protein O [Halorhodospira halophila SL1]ABM60827.1 DNA replication and repair protein RecO [Halorhodospira halophila SL1]